MESSKSMTASSNDDFLKPVPIKSFYEFYTLGEKKGAGAFGIVFEATRKSDNKQLAVKVL